MLDQHHNLLTTDKSTKSRVERIAVVGRNDLWSTILKDNVLGLREEVLHQRILTRKLNFNMTLAKTTTATTSLVCFKAIDSCDRLAEIDKLNIAVQSLACNALHNDMNCLTILLWNKSSIATEEGEDLLAARDALS